MKPLLTWLVLAGIAGTAFRGEGADTGLIRINGAISPATANYIERATRVAAEREHACLVIQLDTPGGLLESTKDIVSHLYESKVPTVVFVAPAGASATSAGCFITLAADIAAMAPNTSIGAAHPVALGGGGGGGAPGGEEQKPDAVMSQKLENYASSYIQSIAEKRGRNAEWAVSSVRESASITAEKALELKVIDLIAADVPELLRKIDGKDVGGRQLRTAGTEVVLIPMLAREKLFQMLWRPEVLLILTLAAIYGLIGELSNPGAIVPGVVGGIALILVLYMSSVLPVNIAGLALIGLALALFVIDIFAPSHGVLTGGGIVAFFLGALMLFNNAGPAFRLSLVYIVPATVLTALFFIFVVGAGLRAQRLPVQVGIQTLIGKSVPVLVAVGPEGGKVFVEGEYWNAVSDRPIEAGKPVEIVSVKGLTLTVRPTTG